MHNKLRQNQYFIKRTKLFKPKLLLISKLWVIAKKKKEKKEEPKERET